jgi:enediyne biosynthesis protein E3
VGAVSVIRKKLFSLSYDEVSFEKLGMECDPRLRPHLEEIPTRFLDGYHIALECEDTKKTAERIDAEIDPAFAGFAYEGAGMMLALFDFATPWDRERSLRFLAHEGAHHDYIVAVGIGFAMARIPWVRSNIERWALRYPPGLAALTLDGFGFHEAFFHKQRYIDRCEVPPELPQHLVGLFTSGVGRVMWFAKGANPDRIAAAIAKFPEERHRDLWAGLGLACAYAGSAYRDLDEYAQVLARLASLAGPNLDHLRLGVVFAAETRRKARNPTTWTSRACERLLDMRFDDAARLGMETWNGLCKEMANRPKEEVGFAIHAIVSQRITTHFARRAHA